MTSARSAIKAGMPADQVPRNLAVDNEVLVPVNKVVHVLVTSTDVIHAWTHPVLRLDGRRRARAASRRPGSRPTKEGIYFGQCSELCGKDHAFMPIAVRVVKDAGVQRLGRRDRRRATARRCKEIILQVAKEQAGQNKVAAR